MHIETNNRAHLTEFIRLNEMWISAHFSIEEADKALAKNPAKVIDNGGFVFSAVDGHAVVGVCALFKDSPERYQLARMAVEPNLRGNGHGRALIQHALKHAQADGASSVYLLSNTVLVPAITLYKRFGFATLSEGQHPVYARCNIIMERAT
jgi:putative acetyltransferase